MAEDLYDRGSLSIAFIDATSINKTKYEPILLSKEVSNEGAVLSYRVHEINDGLLDFPSFSRNIGRIKEYTPEEFFSKYGDEADMVTLEQYRQEHSQIPALRDEVIHRAADIYNKAVDFGFAASKVVYSGTQNYGRIDDELNRKVRENRAIPDAAQKQIERLRDQNTDLRFTGEAMAKRLEDIVNDLAASPDIEVVNTENAVPRASSLVLR